GASPASRCRWCAGGAPPSGSTRGRAPDTVASVPGERHRERSMQSRRARRGISMQRHGLAAPVFLGLAVLRGCGEKPAPSPAAAPSTATAAATATAVAAATVSATASAAAAPAEDPIFAALKGKPQKDDTKPSETVRDGGGVFLGLPKGWTTYDTNKI